MTQNSPGGFIRTEQDAINATEALRLRSRGLTYQRVADIMGISKTAAYHRVQSALAAIPAEAVEEYRKLECERIDLLLEKVMNKALAEDDKGFLFAVDRFITLEERRSKLMGYDAPVKQQVETITYDGSTIEGEVAKLRQILSEHSGESVSVDGQTSSS